MTKISNFPRRSSDRKRLNAIKGRLSCEVTPRWVSFPKESIRNGDIDYLNIDIMTEAADGTDRKLCSLMLDRKMLLKILQELPAKDFVPE